MDYAESLLSGTTRPQEPKMIDYADKLLSPQADYEAQEFKDYEPPPELIGWGDAIKSGIKNFPSSGAKYVKGIFEALSSPKQTIKNIATFGKGLVKTGALRIMANELGYDYDELKASEKDQEIALAENFEKELLKKYGTEEGFKQAIANDPVGVWADMASIAVPIAKGAGMGKIAGSIEPISAAVKIASQPLKLIPERVPIHLYQSAVKFGTTLSLKERDAVTRTAIKSANQIMPTNRGLVKLRGMIDDYNEKIGDLIDKSTNRGTKIDVDKLYQNLRPIKDRIKETSDEPLKVEKEFQAMHKQWVEALKVNSPNPSVLYSERTPAQVQKLKQRIYKDLESYYEKHKATPAKVEIRKAIARNARQSLEDIMPEIKQLNKNEGSLIELWDALESKANRISNRDLIGIGLPVKMGTGSGVGYMFAGEKGAAIGAALGFALGVIDTPQVKAKIALVVNKMREQGIKIKPSKAATALGLYESSKIEGE